MKFRAVDIPNLIYQILRPNYAVTYGDEKTLPALNQMYKFLLACLYPLQPKWNEYDALRRKYYMIASCEPNISNVSNVLNHLFGQYGEIIISNSSLNQMYLYDSYPDDESKQVYLYTEGSENAPVYWGFQGATSNETIVSVPVELQYSGAVIYNAVSVPGGPTIAISDKTAYITNNNWLSYKTVVLPNNASDTALYKSITYSIKGSDQTRPIIAIGDGISAISFDMGETWKAVDFPEGDYTKVVGSYLSNVSIDNHYAIAIGDGLQPMAMYLDLLNGTQTWKPLEGIGSSYTSLCPYKDGFVFMNASQMELVELDNNYQIVNSSVKSLPYGLYYDCAADSTGTRLVFVGKGSAYAASPDYEPVASSSPILPEYVCKSVTYVPQDGSFRTFPFYRSMFVSKDNGNTWSMQEIEGIEGIEKGSYHTIYGTTQGFGLVGNGQMYFQNLSDGTIQTNDAPMSDVWWDFLATLNSLIIYGIKYTIKTY